MGSVWLPLRLVRKYPAMATIHSRARIFGTLLVPEIVMTVVSLWLFLANWIALVVGLVGSRRAPQARTHPLRTPGVMILAAAQVVALVVTAIAAVMVDCALHCS